MIVSLHTTIRITSNLLMDFVDEFEHQCQLNSSHVHHSTHVTKTCYAHLISTISTQLFHVVSSLHNNDVVDIVFPFLSSFLISSFFFDSLKTPSFSYALPKVCYQYDLANTFSFF